MDVEYAFLADAAQTAPDGKLYVLGGGFSEIRARQFPSKHQYMSLVLKLSLHPTECDRPHALEIELWDPDGKAIGPKMSANFTRPRHPRDPGRTTFAQLVMNVVAVEFARPGPYEFHIVVDNQHLKSVPVYLEQISDKNGKAAEGGEKAQSG